MSNSYFQFKQFTVQQENAALKVSTDSCLFGAWLSAEIQTESNVRTVLDIGAGTSLLMLMLAQKCNAFIDGIEIDNPSYEQAKENITASPWRTRLQIFKGDVKNFLFETKYNLILSNPPFYENDLKSHSMNRNVAMHDEGLKFDELLKVVAKNLYDDGLFAVLLPYQRTDQFIADASALNFYLLQRVNVSQTVKHSFFRSMLLFSKKGHGEQRIRTMSIKNEQNEYTVEFTELLKDFYLYL